MLIGDMGIDRLMIHMQQVEEDTLKERGVPKKEGRDNKYEFS